MKIKMLTLRRWLLCTALAGSLLALLLTVGCSGGAERGTGSQGGESGVEVRVASLKGPTSIGIVGMMDKASQGAYKNSYSFTVAGTADEVLPGVVRGDIDIALVPANAAAMLYAKTEGGVGVIDVNTLGVLYVVTGDASVGSLGDLAGRTVYMTGKGTTPEYVMGYLLAQAGLSGDVTLEYKTEATELAALLAEDPSAICVLPEPYATSVCMKDPSLRRAAALSDEWDKVQGDGGSRMVTGVTVVRNEFLEAHPAAVAEFLAAQKASVEAANADPGATAKLVVANGIINDERIAQAAIPGCKLVCLTGQDMKTVLSGYLQVLFEQSPASVGGSLPDDAFYYVDMP